MLRFRLRTKLLFISVIPLILVALILTLIFRFEMQSTGEQQIETMRSLLLEDRKATLKNYIDSAISAAAPVLAKGANSPEVQQEVLALFRAISYAENGYMFVYDFDGNLLANRPDPSQEGANKLNAVDPNGVKVISTLIQKARSGGGFVPYVWFKPSVNRNADKVSYAMQVPGLPWMIGTGVYVDDIEQIVAEKSAHLEEGLNAALWKVSIGTLILLLVVAAIVALIANMMAKPLLRTAHTLDEISQGEGDLTQRLPVDTQDEVGDVARAFNDFATKIQGLVNEVKGAVNTLTSSTDQLEDVVERTRTDVEAQKHETDTVAASIHQMAAAVQEVAGGAARAAGSAHDADQRANDGQQIVATTIDSVHLLATEVDSASEVITRLGNDAAEIGNIIGVISGIAEQTNLLALNAAIEAARAGDHGRGFSVVADEVRTLATRTQESTIEIQQMIERLQSGAREAVSVMEKSRNQTQETIDRAAAANDSLAEITQSVGEINEMNTQIASAAEEQTAVADEISRSVQQIAHIAENSLHNGERVAEMAEQISHIERGLKSLVGRFKS